MLYIEELHENIKHHMNNIEGDSDVIEEVKVNYAAYDGNMKALLASKNIEAY
ncbi:MAG: hypothetical protein ACJAWW_002059, partial [Sulfurimonas sp.]